MVADVTALFQYDFEYFNLGLSSSVYFNDNSSSDIFMSSELSHDFITRNQKFQISPTVAAHFGSQNFYEAYFRNNRFGNGRGQGNGSVSQESSGISLEESGTFNLMAVELSLPIWYTQKKFSVLFIPIYALPQNEATLYVDQELIEEELENMFYWMLGAQYRF